MSTSLSLCPSPGTEQQSLAIALTPLLFVQDPFYQGLQKSSVLFQLTLQCLPGLHSLLASHISLIEPPSFPPITLPCLIWDSSPVLQPVKAIYVFHTSSPAVVTFNLLYTTLWLLFTAITRPISSHFLLWELRTPFAVGLCLKCLGKSSLPLDIKRT